MIIDSEKEYLQFLKDFEHQALIVNVLGCDERYHPATDNLCAVFIKSLFSGFDFVISVNHPDGLYQIDKDRLVKDLSKYQLYTFDKKRTLHYLPCTSLQDIHLIEYFERGEIRDVDKFKTPTHTIIKNMYGKYSDLNCSIPLTVHEKWFENLGDSVLELVKKFDGNISDQGYTRINNVIIDSLQFIEKQGLKVNPEIFNKFFKEKEIKLKNEFVYTEYNIFTSTGRPSNRYGNINYAALKKEDGCRASFVSRYGDDGFLFMIDYSAYHPRLIAKLIRYDLPQDVYQYLGKYYFNKEILTPDEIKAAKTITFQLMYGNISEKYIDIPYFQKIIEYIAHRWNHFTTHGYVETPVFHRRITPNNIKEPNPNKLFNYILQASETEYNSIVLNDLVYRLKDTLTKPILYTYDSVLFDVHKNEENIILKDIKKIMSPMNELPVKCYKGTNYNEMNVISIE